MVGAESVRHSQSHELACCEIRCTTRIIQNFNLLIQFSSTHHLAIETYPSWYIKWSSTKTYKIKKLFNEFFFFAKQRTNINSRRSLMRFFSFLLFTLPSLGLFGSIGSPGVYLTQAYGPANKINSSHFQNPNFTI